MRDLGPVATYWKAHLGNGTGLALGEEEVFQRLRSIVRRSARVLEVGVGKGRLVRLLKEQSPGVALYGIDLTSNVLDCGVPGCVGDARELPFADGQFDAVYSFGVVEHFPETLQAIREQARVVRGGVTW